MRCLLIILVCLCGFEFFQFAQSEEQIPITSNSEDAISKYKEGRAFANIRETDKAESAFREAIKLDSAFSMAYLALGMLRDNYDLRRELIAKAMENIDELSLGEQLWIRGRNAFYGKVKDSDEFDLFKRLVEAYPNDDAAQHLFGYMNLHHGRHNVEAGIFHLNKSIEINPNLVASYNELAYVYMQNGRFEEAEKAVLDYIRLLPEHPDPYDTQADLKLRMGDYEGSLKAYEKVQSIDAKYPWAMIGKAANLDFLNRHSEARSELNKLFDIALSDYEDRHKWRAIQCSFIDEGDIESALKTLLEQNRNAQKRGDFQQAYMSYFRYVRLSFQVGEVNRAMEVYKEWDKFIRENSKNDATRKRVRDYQLYYEAMSAYLENDLSEATTKLDAYDQVSGAVTTDSGLLRSEILIRKGELAKAQEILEALYADNDVLAAFSLATFYKANGNKKKAQELFRQVHDLYDLRDFDYAFVRRRALHEIADQ